MGKGGTQDPLQATCAWVRAPQLTFRMLVFMASSSRKKKRDGKSKPASPGTETKSFLPPTENTNCYNKLHCKSFTFLTVSVSPACVDEGGKTDCATPYDTPDSAQAFNANCCPQPITQQWPRGLMYKALVFRTKDSRFESCRVHCVSWRPGGFLNRHDSCEGSA